jgi:formylglycine-generating enzyme required for sulfatase activity
VANVFLSYKREDAKFAEKFASRLKAEGLSLWWDDRLTPTESWDDEIEENLSAASAVVVLWSPRSVKSEWVRREAHYAQERGKLVPVIVEPCTIPIAFTLNQTVNLAGWDGGSDSKQWRKLLTWIADLSKPADAKESRNSDGVPINRFRDVIGYLGSGEPIVDGALVNASTPAGTVFRDGERQPVMRVVPAGTFLLGASSSDEDRASFEMPQKRIEIPAAFAIGVFPVLAAEYAPKASPGPAIPLTGVSFVEAVDFAARVSTATGAKYRIPSEAEWEYACRAGSSTRYWHGDRIESTHAAFGLSSGPVECGRFAPNPFGLYDMHGNVREWTADLWHDSYEKTPLDGRPAEEGHGSLRPVRGGAWSDQPAMLRSAARMRATQTVRSNLIGLRLVRALG